MQSVCSSHSSNCCMYPVVDVPSDADDASTEDIAVPASLPIHVRASVWARACGAPLLYLRLMLAQLSLGVVLPTDDLMMVEIFSGMEALSSSFARAGSKTFAFEFWKSKACLSEHSHGRSMHRCAIRLGHAKFPWLWWLPLHLWPDLDATSGCALLFSATMLNLHFCIRFENWAYLCRCFGQGLADEDSLGKCHCSQELFCCDGVHRTCAYEDWLSTPCSTCDGGELHHRAADQLALVRASGHRMSLPGV